MALYDNKHWLLSHIRNSFISSDDTGMCEVVMMGENIPQEMPNPKYSVYPGLEDSDNEDDLDNLSQSIEIHSDLQYGLLRHRSNTASKLEKMEQARKKAAQIRTIKWKRTPMNASEKNLNKDAFARKDIKPVPKQPPSLLAQQLQRAPHIPSNPFQDYSRYDGNAQVGISTRKYKIYIHMLPKEQRNYPMEVVIITGARIKDLIGLALYKCFIDFPELGLKHIDNYGLHIAEDDGEVDWDFPSFEESEYIAKFGFGYLALVERENDTKPTSTSNNTELEIMKLPTITPGVDSNRKLEEILAEAFGQSHINPWQNLAAPLYQSFKVFMLSKFGSKTEIMLGVSGEKIEIDPLTSSKSGTRILWGKTKSVSYHIDLIVACDLTHSKSNRATFRLVYDQAHDLDSSNSNSPYGMSTSYIHLANHQFKHHDFVASYKTADEIVQKINSILDLRSSPKRKDYLEMRENKSHRRKSFTFGPR